MLVEISGQGRVLMILEIILASIFKKKVGVQKTGSVIMNDQIISVCVGVKRRWQYEDIKLIEFGKTIEYQDKELGAICTWDQILSPVIINDQQTTFVELVKGKGKTFFAIQITLTLNFVCCEITQGNIVL